MCFCLGVFFFFFFKQKTAYDIGWCDWSSDVCSSDLDGLQVVKSIADASRPSFSRCTGDVDHKLESDAGRDPHVTDNIESGTRQGYLIRVVSTIFWRYFLTLHPPQIEDNRKTSVQQKA